jgi:endogenous inhibitor of DNA gyrase (YacG/DUF329 family)
MIDLGAWLSEQRAIPGDTAPLESDAEDTQPGAKHQDPDSI